MRFFILVLGLSLLSGAAHAQDRASIEKLNSALELAFNKGDFAAVANMYSEEAYLLPPGADMAKGRSSIQAFWTQAGQAVGNLKLTTVDVKALGSDAAREIGTFSFMTKGQAQQQVKGKYVVVWEKIGGEWKIAADIWNADK